MNYTISKQPKVIYQAITYEFTLSNDEGDSFQIRYVDEDNGSTYFILTDGKWNEFYPDDDMLEFIMNEIEF